MEGDSSFARSGCIAVSIGLLLLFIASPLAHASQTATGQAGLRIEPQGDFSASWDIQDASLDESFSGTTGRIAIRNASRMIFNDAVLYAEYLDSSGRLCMSLIFSLQKNVGSKGPMGPGETRVLKSTNSGLFLASEPAAVKVWLAREQQENSAASREWTVPIRAPITLSGGLSAEASRVELHTKSTDLPFSDLLLAKVRVSEHGTTDEADVINAVNSEAADWFRDFAQREATFFPASNGVTWVSGEALVLVRELSGGDLNLRGTAFSPRMSPWVTSYLTRSGGEETPPITMILLAPPATKFKPAGSSEWVERPAAPGVLDIVSAGSDWSNPAIKMIADPTAPHHMRRELSISDNGAGLNRRDEQQHR